MTQWGSVDAGFLVLLLLLPHSLSPPPPTAPVPCVQALGLRCFHADPEQRPTFEDIIGRIQDLLGA